MGPKEEADKELTDEKRLLPRASRMKTVLDQAFTPLSLEIADDSHRHAGHAGARAEGETHYSVRMVSEAFSGLSRVARHQKVMAALKDEFDSGLHALSLELKTPTEAER